MLWTASYTSDGPRCPVAPVDPGSPAGRLNEASVLGLISALVSVRLLILARVIVRFFSFLPATLLLTMLAPSILAAAYAPPPSATNSARYATTVA